MSLATRTMQALRVAGLTSAGAGDLATIIDRINPIQIYPDAATIKIEPALSHWHQITLGGNRTLAVPADLTYEQFALRLIQAAAGGPYNPIWWSGITWFTSTFSAPTMPTTAGGVMVCTFKCTGAGTFDGFLCGASSS